MKYLFFRLLLPMLATGLFVLPFGRTVLAANGVAELYVSKGCYACHGYVGQGGGAGPPLASTGLSIIAFTQQLRAPAENMPPYTINVLTDDEVAQLYNYVRSFPIK
jgi:mono/diheme cytochrome c family protein